MPLFKKKKAHGHEIHEGMSNVGHDPYIDWLIILVVSLVILVGLVTLGILSFRKVGRILSQPPTMATTSVSSAIDPEMLEHVLGQFEVRARERAELLKGYKGPLDPSL